MMPTPSFEGLEPLAMKGRKDYVAFLQVGQKTTTVCAGEEHLLQQKNDTKTARGNDDTQRDQYKSIK